MIKRRMWIFVIIVLGILIFSGIFALNNKKTNNSADTDMNKGTSNTTDEKYGITKTIYYDDKYSVEIKFPDEYYDCIPELEDTASFYNEGFVQFKGYSDKDREVDYLQSKLDMAKASETYTTYFEDVKTTQINNMDVYYIYYMDNKHDIYSIKADIYIKPDAKYDIELMLDSDNEVTNEEKAYSKLVKIVNTIGKIKEL